VIIEKEFIKLKYWLLEKGFKVVEVSFREVSKLGGLFRCATLPLVRR
jgi:N-dimethylarginine dimethylaminohydrolase